MGAERVQRLALPGEINLVQTAVHPGKLSGKLSGSTHNLLKGELTQLQSSSLILMAWSVADNASLFT